MSEDPEVPAFGAAPIEPSVGGATRMASGVVGFAGRLVRRATLLGLVSFGLLIALVLLLTGQAMIVAAAMGAAIVGWLLLHMRVDRLLPIAVLITFTIDNPAEQPYSDAWKPWWSSLNDLWFENIRKTVPGTALPLSPLFIVLIICALRSISSAENRSHDPQTKQLRQAAALSLTTLGVLEVFGVATGGKIDTSLRQMTWLAGVPIVALAVIYATRSAPRLIRRIEMAVVASALIKAIVAIILYFAVIRKEMLRPLVYSTKGVPIPPLEYVSTHSDSVLWLWALLLLGGYWLEGRRRGSLLMLMLIGTPLMAAILFNARRTSWVELGAAGIFMLALLRPALKRQVGRLVNVGWPLAVMYVVIGWNTGSSLFAPVQSIRSVFNSNDDSNITRDVENLNLIYTFRARPLTGWGFGHPYIEVVKSFDISSALKEYLYIPHNSLLGLFAFGGPIGFLGFWTVVVVGVTLAVKAYRMLPEGRSGPLTGVRVRVGWAVGGLIAYALQSSADIGLQSVYPALIAGLCCGITGSALRTASELRAQADLEAASRPVRDDSVLPGTVMESERPELAVHS